MSKPLHHLTDDQLANYLENVVLDELDGFASEAEIGAIEEAARRLRRGSGNATAVDCTSAGDITVTADGAPRRWS